jgi:hypothetical protein
MTTNRTPRPFNEETIVAYDKDGNGIKAERLQRRYYNKLNAHDALVAENECLKAEVADDDKERSEIYKQKDALVGALKLLVLSPSVQKAYPGGVKQAESALRMAGEEV